MRYLLAGAVLLLALAGCAVPTPTPLTDDELDAYAYEMQGRALYDMGGELRPTIEPTFVAADEMEQALNDCELSAAECAVTYIYYPEDLGYLSGSELGYVYDYYASELVPCLATQGLDVGYAPTRAEFSYAGWMSWDPYSELGANLPPSRAEAIRAQCPPYPPMPFTEAYG